MMTQVLIAIAVVLALAGLFALARQQQQHRRALNPTDPTRSPICPGCDQRMGWSLTCRCCDRSWATPGELDEETAEVLRALYGDYDPPTHCRAAERSHGRPRRH